MEFFEGGGVKQSTKLYPLPMVGLGVGLSRGQYKTGGVGASSRG